MAERITVYMCSQKPNVIDAPSMPSVSDLTSEWDEENKKAVVTVWVHKIYSENEDDCLSDQGNRILETKMLPLGRELIPCLWGDNDSLSWSRGIVEDARGKFQYRNDFLTIEWENPSENCGLCFWKLTMIVAKNPLEINFRYPYIFSVAPESTTGMIPESGDKEAYWISDASTELHNESQPAIMPGEILNVVWYMLINGELLSHTVNGLYYRTPLFTGGEIISVHNEDTTNLKYVVNIEGEQYECMPTDFAQYEVGSWVYILRQGSTEAKTANRQTAYADSTGSEEEEEETLIDLVNSARKDNDLYPLRKNDDKLQEAANNHAKYMAINQYMGHDEDENKTGFTGTSPFNRAGYVEYKGTTIAENVGYGYETTVEQFSAWMESPGHRANILSDLITEMGFAKVQASDDDWYYCPVFGDYAEQLAEEVEDISTAYRVIPVTMGESLVDRNNFETLDYDHASNFTEVHDMSYHDAVIKEVSGDYAKIEMTISTGDPDDEEEEVEYDNVPIFYHCVDSNTVSGGGSAFSEDDEVLVLNEGEANPDNYELTIVGFKNQLKRCVRDVFLLFSVPNKPDSEIWEYPLFSFWKLSDGKLELIELKNLLYSEYTGQYYLETEETVPQPIEEWLYVDSVDELGNMGYKKVHINTLLQENDYTQVCTIENDEDNFYGDMSDNVNSIENHSWAIPAGFSLNQDMKDNIQPIYELDPDKYYGLFYTVPESFIFYRGGGSITLDPNTTTSNSGEEISVRIQGTGEDPYGRPYCWDYERTYEKIADIIDESWWEWELWTNWNYDSHHQIEEVDPSSAWVPFNSIPWYGNTMMSSSGYVSEISIDGTYSWGDGGMRSSFWWDKCEPLGAEMPTPCKSKSTMQYYSDFVHYAGSYLWRQFFDLVTDGADSAWVMDSSADQFFAFGRKEEVYFEKDSAVYHVWEDAWTQHTVPCRLDCIVYNYSDSADSLGQIYMRTEKKLTMTFFKGEQDAELQRREELDSVWYHDESENTRIYNPPQEELGYWNNTNNRFVYSPYDSTWAYRNGPYEQYEFRQFDNSSFLISEDQGFLAFNQRIFYQLARNWDKIDYRAYWDPLYSYQLVEPGTRSHNKLYVHLAEQNNNDQFILSLDSAKYQDVDLSPVIALHNDLAFHQETRIYRDTEYTENGFCSDIDNYWAEEHPDSFPSYGLPWAVASLAWNFTFDDWDLRLHSVWK